MWAALNLAGVITMTSSLLVMLGAAYRRGRS
jgi:hypothetical protein